MASQEQFSKNIPSRFQLMASPLSRAGGRSYAFGREGPAGPAGGPVRGPEYLAMRRRFAWVLGPLALALATGLPAADAARVTGAGNASMWVDAEPLPCSFSHCTTHRFSLNGTFAIGGEPISLKFVSSRFHVHE